MSTQAIRPMVKPAARPMPVRFVRRRKGLPMRMDLSEMPEPVEQCDGTWRVPMWHPDYGWELCEVEARGSYKSGRTFSRAACGDPFCTCLHKEEFEEYSAATTKEDRARIIKRHNREQRAREAAARVEVRH